MTREELSLLLYLESCAVDSSGAVDGRRMNADDFTTADRWNQTGYVEFGRICAADLRVGGSHWCKLSDAAWIDVHVERRARAERLWERRSWRSTEEARAATGGE